MSRLSLLAFMLAIAGCQSQPTALKADTPQFKDVGPITDAFFAQHQIAVTPLKKKAPLILKNKLARTYRTRLKEEWAEAKEPNLADHYYAFEHVGCGTGCVVIAVADWNTGEVFDNGLYGIFETHRSSDIIVLSPGGTCEYVGFHSVYQLVNGKALKIVDDYCAETP